MPWCSAASKSDKGYEAFRSHIYTQLVAVGHPEMRLDNYMGH